MKQEYSAGVIVYYEHAQQREYLLLHYQAGHWDLPKGHIDPGETKEQTALREVMEETGLEVSLEENFQESFSYFFKYPEKNGLVQKTVYFFIGRTKTKEVVLSHEHIGFIWLTYQEALKQLTYKNAKGLLAKAEKFLNKT